jgi:prepilin-type N-terminal cleavage/methylation domain-containing protein/prepilin-type processing-associated H-X9-DG protein
MKRRQGFTLIELLVTVAIIALLIALLLPSLGKAREEAKLVKCAANLKGIGTAFASYAHTNNDLMPQAEVYNWKHPADTAGNFAFAERDRGWFSPPLQYLNMTWPEALYINGDIQTGSGNKGGKANNNSSWHYPICWEKLFQCPNNARELQQNQSGASVWGYGMAWQATSNWKTDNGWGSWNTYHRRLIPHHIVAAEGMVAMARMGGYNSPDTSIYGVFKRHKRGTAFGANFLMGDGHVEWSSKFGSYPSLPAANYPSDSDKTSGKFNSPRDVWLHPH